MPAVIGEEPLGISCVFGDGSRAEFFFDGLPNPRLARDLVTGLVELIFPHGAVNAAGTVGLYAQAIRDMTRTLAAGGFTGGAADLRRAQLAEYWMAAGGPREACTRLILRALPAAGGEIDAGVVDLAAGRAFNPQRNHRQLPPYPEVQWDRLTEACREVADRGYAAHREALAAAEHGRHPTDGGWTAGNVCWLLTRLGPVSTRRFAAELGCTPAAVQQRGGFPQASRDLFGSVDEVIAYRLLLGIYSGIVPDGIDDLLAGDIDWAGDSTILLSYVKGRTAAESLTLPRRAVRLLEQWLARSALLRGFLGEPDRRRLWLAPKVPGQLATLAGTSGRVAIQRWIRQHDVHDQDGRPVKIHRSRIRTTHLAMRARGGWIGSGRATIDPNHSPHVEGDHYLSAGTPTQQRAVEAIVEDAQHDLLRRAHPPAVLTDTDTAELARDYPTLVAGLALDDAVIAELVGGARDVFVAACADQLSGLHGPKGKPCPARPWVCLLCPLAVFAPRHAANLLRLKAFFSRQWQAMPAAAFMAVFGPYSQRIGQVLDRFDPAVLAAAGRGVDDRDDEIPLRPEEFTR